MCLSHSPSPLPNPQSLSRTKLSIWKFIVLKLRARCRENRWHKPVIIPSQYRTTNCIRMLLNVGELPNFCSERPELFTKIALIAIEQLFIVEYIVGIVEIDIEIEVAVTNNKSDKSNVKSLLRWWMILFKSNGRRGTQRRSLKWDGFDQVNFDLSECNYIQVEWLEQDGFWTSKLIWAIRQNHLSKRMHTDHIRCAHRQNNKSCDVRNLYSMRFECIAVYGLTDLFTVVLSCECHDRMISKC